jgi:hypothetical protein
MGNKSLFEHSAKNKRLHQYLLTAIIILHNGEITQYLNHFKWTKIAIRNSKINFIYMTDIKKTTVWI